MRTRALVVTAVLSVAANLALGTALWSTWRAARRAAARLPSACADASCQEERRVREQLATELCRHRPDRAAIETTLVQLDAVRAARRREIVDRWLSHNSGASERERARLRHNVTRLLCPWHDGRIEDHCAHSPASGTPSNHRAQPEQGRRTE